MSKNYGPCSECKDMCYGRYYAHGFMCDGCAVEYVSQGMAAPISTEALLQNPVLMFFPASRVSIEMDKVKRIVRAGRTITITIGDNELPLERLHLQYKSSDMSDSDFESALDQQIRYEESEGS